MISFFSNYDVNRWLDAPIESRHRRWDGAQVTPSAETPGAFIGATRAPRMDFGVRNCLAFLIDLHTCEEQNAPLPSRYFAPTATSRCPGNTKATENTLVEAITTATRGILVHHPSPAVSGQHEGCGNVQLPNTDRRPTFATSLRIRSLRCPRFLQRVWRLSAAAMEEAVDWTRHLWARR